MTDIPDGIPQDVWVAADEALDNLLCNDIEASGSSKQFRIDSVTSIARAILAEREASEARMLQLLKDPVAVRLNWMRGGINVSSVLPDEIDLFRLLKKSGGKRGYGQIARYLAAAIRHPA
jgi:hypothetical protein